MFYYLILLICLVLLIKILEINNLYFKSWRRGSTYRDAAALQRFLEQPPKLRQKSTIPIYKFYSELVRILIVSKTKFGGEIEEILFEIKKQIKVDIKETRKISEIFIGGLFQALFASFFIIIFFFISQTILEIKLDRFHMVGLIMWLSLSVVVYIFLFKMIRHKKFKSFESYLKSFYKFRILISISRPLNEVVEETQISNLATSSKLNPLKQRIDGFVSKIKNTGSFHPREMDLILGEVWDYYDFELTSFQKYNAILKLFLMAFFILPSFMFSIYRLFDGLQL